MDSSSELSLASSSSSEVKVSSSNENDRKCELPCFNVPEKIIIVFDRAQDENCTEFSLKGKSCSPFEMLKKALEIFLFNKNAINSKHQFALVEINETKAEWLQDFTSNPQVIVRNLKKIEECETEDIFNLNTIFDAIIDKINVSYDNDLNEIPNFVTRLILTYGRSYTIPLLEKTNEIVQLLDSPYFIIDCIMTHEPTGIDNNCQKNFENLQGVDLKGLSYNFSVARNSEELFASMAKLLAHPLQRPLQNKANYNFKT